MEEIALDVAIKNAIEKTRLVTERGELRQLIEDECRCELQDPSQQNQVVRDQPRLSAETIRINQWRLLPLRENPTKLISARPEIIRSS